MADISSGDARALYSAARDAGVSPLLLNSGAWALDRDVVEQVASAARLPILAGFLDAAPPQRRQDAGGAPAVAVIPLTGVITPQGSFLSFLFGGTPGGLAGFREQLSAAAANSDVTSILIDVDSPGGLADMVPETAELVREVRSVKPVTAVVDTMMGSAAYWIGSQASEVVVTPSGYAGSIGVYRVHVDESGLNEKMGVTVTYVSAGKYKLEGNPDEPLGQTAKRAWQSSVDDVYGEFVADVAQGRSASVESVRSGFGEGRMLRGERAVRAGLADRVATYDEALAGLLGGPVPAPALDPAPDDPPEADDGDEEAVSLRPSVATLSLEERRVRARLLTQ